MERELSPSIKLPNNLNVQESELSYQVKPRNKPQIILKSEDLQTKMRLHGLTNILFPSVGTVLAIATIPQLGFGSVQLGLLVSIYTLNVIGITVGFHRHFAHCAFQANTITRIILIVLGSMAAQGPLIYWVATHRRHHQYSDTFGDPHSPYLKGEKKLGFFQGLWHSHMGWTFDHEITNTFLFAKDLMRNSLISKVSQLYYLWNLIGIVIPILLGAMLIGGWKGALSGLLWGGCVRLFLIHHSSWTIGSISHIYGYRPFNTSDSSRNNIWLAIPTGGESWHNNHHAFPNSAFFGLRWWQIDFGAWVIKGLEKLGLVWDVKVPSAQAQEAKKSALKK